MIRSIHFFLRCCGLRLWLFDDADVCTGMCIAKHLLSVRVGVCGCV